MNTKSLPMALALVCGLLFSALTGCATRDEFIDDRTVALRVKEALGDNREYKFNDVNVAVYRGTAQLSGFVNSNDQRRKAEDIAERVHGVKRVDNKISLKE